MSSERRASTISPLSTAAPRLLPAPAAAPLPLPPILTLLPLLPLLPLLVLVGCGKQGPPVPPFRALPAPTKDLDVRQRGGLVVLSFLYPQMTPSGKPLNGLSAVEVWEALLPAPAQGELEPIDPRQFTGAAKLKVKLSAKEVAAATLGNRIEIELALPSPLPATPQLHDFAVRTLGPQGDRSEPSNQALLLPRTPPRPPLSVTVTPQADGVLVSWVPAPQPPPAPPAQTTGGTGGTQGQASPGATQGKTSPGATAPSQAAAGATAPNQSASSATAQDKSAPGAATQGKPAPAASAQGKAAQEKPATGTTPAPATTPAPSRFAGVGFHVYRRGASERTSSKPLHASKPEETSFLDTTASFGQSYIYVVTAVDPQDSRIESTVQAEREIKYVDRFPPPVPADLVGVAEPGRVRLVWKASDAGDLAGYIVYRKGPQGDFQRLTEKPLAVIGYADSTVEAGKTYVYRVTAIDQTGNESAPSPEASVAVPAGS